ncbi:MAG: hypothetical protein CVV32_04045 [Methanomicrobiales archaeon HGW-Methanomicrobiales-3]|jgi:hypothetical protein|nr:MAG: hypothetical protein CVV32_04045 [Methanomicrobiales archaeon HGW-Methanomicrobiales-3]
MRIDLLIPALSALILIVLAVVPVHAERAEDLAREASLDFFGIDLTDPKPAYQWTAQDYLDAGNAHKEKCEYYSNLYDEQLRAYVRQEALAQNPAADTAALMNNLKNPTLQQRGYVMSTGFHQKDPLAQTYWDSMLAACNEAEQNYNAALDKTPEDDYRQQAEIFNQGAGIYDALGQTEEAGQVRDAAAVALAHAESDMYLPLPWWLPLLGVMSAVVILHRRRQ